MFRCTIQDGARVFTKLQCGNSIIYITYLVISAAPPCSMTLTRLMRISVKYCVIYTSGCINQTAYAGSQWERFSVVTWFGSEFLNFSLNFRFYSHSMSYRAAAYLYAPAHACSCLCVNVYYTSSHPHLQPKFTLPPLSL